MSYIKKGWYYARFYCFHINKYTILISQSQQIIKKNVILLSFFGANSAKKSAVAAGRIEVDNLLIFRVGKTFTLK